MSDDQAMPEPLEPRPNDALCAMAVFVIVGCLISASRSIAVLSRQREAWGIEGWAALVVLVSSLAVAALQYRGVVHWRPGAALAVACLFLVIGGLCTIAAAAFIPLLCTENWVQQRDSDELMAVLFSIVVGTSVSAFALAVAWQNWRWAVGVTAARWTGPKPRLTLGELLAAVTILAVTAAIARWSAGEASSIVVVEEDALPHLSPGRVPASAKGICYRVDGHGGLALEFTADEATFRKWVAEVVARMGHHKPGYRVEPLAEFHTPKNVRRYDGESTEIRQGLEYASWFEDQGVSATFDSAAGRVYFQAHWH